ncbi:T9SS type A sorting domain-containing protein [bacterium]|nr:T9SS type A sorting domain-containing protein [bacterium]
MKRLNLIFTLLIFSGLTAFGQTVENGSFEVWDKYEYYKLDSWFTPTRNVSRTTDSKEGKYALKLENTISETGAKYRSYAYNRYIPAGLRGFKFEDEALSLVFWAKYDLAEGDSGRIVAYLRKDGVTKGYVDFSMYGSTNDNYVKHSVPIYWYSSRIPDTAWIYLYSYTETDVDGPGYIIFDDIHFENIGKRGHDMTNQGFENWTDLGVEYPHNWRSLDLLYIDNYSTFLPERSAFKSEDAVVGDYSLKVSNYESNDIPRRSYIFIGTEDVHRYTPSYIVSNRYEYIQGYYKMVSDAEDSAYMQFRTYGNGRYYSNNVVYFTPNNRWQHFSAPISYYYADSIPDSAYLAIYSGTGVIKSSNTALYLDGLELVNEPYSVSIAPLETGAKVYPNPTSSGITIELEEPSYIQILNTQGVILESMNLEAGRQELNLEQLPVGVYYIYAKTKDKKTWQKKIMKR